MVVRGLILLVRTSWARRGQQARCLMTHSDSQICLRKPPLFPSPEAVQYCCAIQGRLELLDSARGLGSTVA